MKLASELEEGIEKQAEVEFQEISSVVTTASYYIATSSYYIATFFGKPAFFLSHVS